ncbi:MAG: hypothetical protein NTW55_03100, partial [Planctomycetota bacterium]|nr:hypothetical protein [Planctomycetota bacterium]
SFGVHDSSCLYVCSLTTEYLNRTLLKNPRLLNHYINMYAYTNILSDAILSKVEGDGRATRFKNKKSARRASDHVAAGENPCQKSLWLKIFRPKI